jgi:hypothetical protein
MGLTIFRALAGFLFLSFTGSCIAQIAAITSDGKDVILNADGSWQYAEDSAGNELSALETLKAYLFAESLSERLEYVLPKQNDIAEMRSFYRPYNKADRNSWELGAPEEKFGDRVEIEAYNRALTFPLTYHLESTDNGYRVDWGTSVGLNEMSVAEYKASKPIEPVTFRVIARLSDTYLSHYRDDKDMYYSISLSVLGTESNSRFGYGYVIKDTFDGKHLFSVLKDGKPHLMTLDLKFPIGDTSMIGRIVNIDGWRIR